MSEDFERIRYDVLEEGVPEDSFNDVEKRIDTGFKLSVMLGIILVIGVVFSGVFGCVAKPKFDIAFQDSTGGADQYSLMVKSWVSEIIRMLGAFFQPLVPVLASILGYTFGANRSK